MDLTEELGWLGVRQMNIAKANSILELLMIDSSDFDLSSCNIASNLQKNPFLETMMITPTEIKKDSLLASNPFTKHPEATELYEKTAPKCVNHQPICSQSNYRLIPYGESSSRLAARKMNKRDMKILKILVDIPRQFNNFSQLWSLVEIKNMGVFENNSNKLAEISSEVLIGIQSKTSLLSKSAMLCIENSEKDQEDNTENHTTINNPPDDIKLFGLIANNIRKIAELTKIISSKSIRLLSSKISVESQAEKVVLPVHLAHGSTVENSEKTQHDIQSVNEDQYTTINNSDFSDYLDQLSGLEIKEQPNETEYGRKNTKTNKILWTSTSEVIIKPLVSQESLYYSSQELGDTDSITINHDYSEENITDETHLSQVQELNVENNPRINIDIFSDSSKEIKALVSKERQELIDFESLKKSLNIFNETEEMMKKSISKPAYNPLMSDFLKIEICQKVSQPPEEITDSSYEISLINQLDVHRSNIYSIPPIHHITQSSNENYTHSPSHTTPPKDEISISNTPISTYVTPEELFSASVDNKSEIPEIINKCSNPLDKITISFKDTRRNLLSNIPENANLLGSSIIIPVKVKSDVKSHSLHSSPYKDLTKTDSEDITDSKIVPNKVHLDANPHDCILMNLYPTDSESDSSDSSDSSEEIPHGIVYQEPRIYSTANPGEFRMDSGFFSYDNLLQDEMNGFSKSLIFSGPIPNYETKVDSRFYSDKPSDTYEINIGLKSLIIAPAVLSDTDTGLRLNADITIEGNEKEIEFETTENSISVPNESISESSSILDSHDHLQKTRIQATPFDFTNSVVEKNGMEFESFDKTLVGNYEIETVPKIDKDLLQMSDHMLSAHEMETSPQNDKDLNSLEDTPVNYRDPKSQPSNIPDKSKIDSKTFGNSSQILEEKKTNEEFLKHLLMNTYEESKDSQIVTSNHTDDMNSHDCTFVSTSSTLKEQLNICNPPSTILSSDPDPNFFLNVLKNIKSFPDSNLEESMFELKLDASTMRIEEITQDHFNEAENSEVKCKPEPIEYQSSIHLEETGVEEQEDIEREIRNIVEDQSDENLAESLFTLLPASTYFQENLEPDESVFEILEPEEGMRNERRKCTDDNYLEKLDQCDSDEESENCKGLKKNNPQQCLLF